uniref:FAT atypical cadherin 4 n=1 Tax=Chelydra serpentina TaxID=8475 RepID=A0A8C3SY76_CHESE
MGLLSAGSPSPSWLPPFALLLLLPLHVSAEPRQVFQVREEQPPGTWVGTIVTRPGFTYRLSEHHALFSINATSGALHTRATIDRESLASDVMDLVVLSSQPTYPSEVRVLVLDLNDNAPVFPDPSIVVTFKEDTGSGRQLILDTATDADSGTNGVDHSSYRIVAGNEEGRFQLNITLNPSGEGAFLHLVSRGGLDREATPTYQLLVQVEDKGEPRRHGYLQVNVTVQDINDNPPVFSQALYQARVPEDAPVGASVLQVAAADADEGTNADIHYRLEGTEGGGGEGAGGIPFEVDPESGVIRIREPLDYETRRQYSLTVQATDRGVPALSGRAEALIRLLDVNDNEPRVKFRYFPATSRFASVDENAAPGTVVALLTVSDADSPAANGNISVSILGGNEQRHFEVQSSKVPNLSLIKVAAALDRERIPTYNLTVAVADNYGAPPPPAGSPTSSVPPEGLVIFVNDINDHPPVFGQSVYRVNISEEVPPGSYVKGLSATDCDSGLNANLKYSIVSGNELGWFCISEHSGLVTTTGIAGSGTSLVVAILDVNDQRPLFSQPDGYQVSLAENSPSGTELLVLSVTDGDLGDNGTVLTAVGPLVAPRRVFRLDPVSGKLSTISQLDREEQDHYSLQVLATDLGSPPLSSVARVNVSLLDVNDNSPVFYPVQYFAHIQENEPAGSYVTIVSASDPDLGPNGTIKYSISAGDNSRFQIHGQTGVITTKIALDREEKTAYQLQIVATDGGNLQSQNQAIVTITVLDTQDNPPVFNQVVYSFVVFENVALGYHVGTVFASTMDLNTNITYLITTGDQRGMFAINKVMGQITTASIIDREEQAFYQLKVVASGGAITGDTMVNITVKDLNDNSPHFLHAVESVNVVENWKAGHTIFQAKAVDPDEGVNGMVIYSLKQNPKGLFTINEQNGAISLIGPLDINAGSYQVEILASDMGVPQRSSSFILTVSVHDVNDNPPVFDQLSYEVTISESEPVNSRFFKVQASDRDSGANGEVAYSIIEGNSGDAFGIFPDGQLYIKSELDRELQERYILLVVASDRAVEPLSATVNVTIILEDVNDNRPLFNSTNYVFYFEEEQNGGSSVGKISAVDKDFGQNGEVRYSFENMQPDFELNTISGEITSTHQFDRETLMRQRGAAVFSLTVIVTDQGLPKPLKDQATVQIYMKDINDNAPKFLKDLYQATISELAANLTQVLRVSASDVDEGSNGLIHYSVIKGNEENQFTIDSGTGQVTLIGKLDHEATASYSLIIQAVDSGTVSLSSTCTLSIDVLDENDNSPSFPKSTLLVDVLENMRIGELVSSVTATDSDSGDNADLHYSITGTNNHGTFSISPNTGSIFLAKKLDFETQSLYKLNITAKDQGRPPRSATMSVVIHVRDFNDNPPNFPPGDVFKSIVENIPVGSSVISVTAHDPDADINGQLTYAIIQQMPRGNHFSIDEVRGTIFTNAEIDREFANLFELTVKATDQAVPVESRRFALKNVTILVTDQNDNVPTFISQNALAANPSVVIGSVLTTIIAADPDEGANGEVEYEIINGDTETFIVDRYSGDLRVAAALVPSQLIYNLIVSATDLGPERRKSTTEMTVILQGLDGPVFTQSKYITILKEGEPIGTNVISIEAGANALVTYTIISGADNSFHIDPESGDLIATKRLDRERRSKYSLLVRADDGLQSSDMRINITISDVNDHIPKFSKPVTMGLSYSPYFCFTGSNSQLSYSITSGDSLGQFNIDKNGVLSIKQPLDRESQSFYSLVVQVHDMATLPASRYTSTTQVSIILLDVNDNPPSFISPKLTYIPENTPIDTIVFRAQATDPDSGPNSYIEYTLLRPLGNKFSIGTIDGEVRLIGELDRESVANYTLTVVATDKGQPCLSSSTDVVVVVLDINDNNPLFAQKLYKVEVGENTLTGTDLTQVFATDGDEGTNGQVRYSIISGNTNNEFRIDSVTGVITVAKPLDREKKPSYSLTVQSSDRGSSPRTDTATVSIVLMDVNDFIPTFELSPYSVQVPENLGTLPNVILQVSSFVFAVTVTDADSGPNAELHYSLMGKNSEKFHIDPTRGAIMAAEPMTGASEVTFSIHVKDSGLHPKTDSTTVTVRFVNKADFPQVQAEQQTFIFPENQATGTLVTTVSGSSSRGGSLSYYIASGNLCNTFQIDQLTGQFSISQPLDFEEIQKYVVWIEARDTGFPPFSSYEKLEVTVVDVNDNAPEFERDPFIAEIMENLSPRKILTLTAVDKDSGPNGQLNYEIIDGNKENSFSISRATGEIRSVRPLDREKLARYTLTIRVSDGGAPLQSTTVKVIVNILDENDNAPRFSQIFSAPVPENAPLGYTVTRVTTSDEDIGVNAISRYSIRDTSLPFIINPSTGDITISRHLNREDTDRYRIRVSAHDSGWTVSTDVTIFVTDINDNAPRFTKTSYYLDCPELAEVGLKVTQVSATDPDEGSNGQVFYFIKSQSEFFRINATTGEIFNKQYLRYQNSSGSSNININRHSFIVTSSDRGSPSLLSETTVTINIVDSNDNAPQFLASKYFTPVTKNVAVGTKLVKVTAVDYKDFGLNSEVEYFISNENDTDKFKLDSTTGWISVASSLMTDLNQNFLLTVKAKDKGNPPLSSEVTVQIVITEENYHTPEFSQSHMSVTIPESHVVGAVVRTVSARDRDAAMNGLITYNISSGNEAGIFAINTSTGALTLAKPLDYELCQNHEMIVSATDGGWVARTGYCSVTVNVIDVNDNSPIFSPEDYFPNVLENAPSGTTVIRLNATDADSGPNAMIAYAVQSSDSDLFVIDPNTGIITTQGFLDYETKQSYHLTVKAFNVPDEERCSFASVNIQLEGTNEYVPRFVSKLYYFEVSEAASKGMVVGEVFASDRDMGTDGEVHYLIFGSSRKKGFQINEKSGQIYVSGPLDREKEERISLKVLAKNFGSIRGADVDEVIVNITVLDANDPPDFSLQVYNIQISEGVPPGTHVTFVSAFDSDSVPSWSRFSYFIGSGNDNGAFSINPQTGQVTVTAELDRETLPVYNLTVLAIDSGTPSATGSASLLVTLEDINDNGPTLSTGQGEVMENNRAGTLVMALQSSDPDLPPNQGPFTYYLLSTGPATSYFSLSTAGILTTTREIDREQIGDFYLSVITRDSGIPQMSSTGTVQIKVIDQNDNPSQSRTVEIFVHYYGNLFPGGILGSVKPQDPDVLDSFHCSLTSGVTSLFNIPGGTCDLNSQRNIPEVYTADGQWHSLLIEKNGSVTVLSIDKTYSKEILHVTQDFGGLNVITVSLGGIPPSHTPRSTETGKKENAHTHTHISFYLGESLPFSGKHSIATISKTDPFVKIGCRGPNICASNPCWGELMCINQWYAYKCVPPGACASNPCQNGGSCEPGAHSGFTCSCPESYTGRTCETVVACLGILCAQGHVCKGGINGGHICVPHPHPAELSLPLWAVPAIVGSCATVLALLVLSLILCNQCRGKKTKVPKEERKMKEKKKKGSENVAFDDPDNIPPYGDDMTVRKQPEGNPKPDIIERENPYLIYDETDIPHNAETIPSAPLASPEPEIEHYDIENASSIAPSDADIIQHYKQFRSHTPKFSIQRHSPLGFARQSPMPLGASSLTYQPSYSQGLRTTSLSHSACPTSNPLSRHSPAPFSKSSAFYRNSPARELHLSIREGSPLEMHNDVCQPGIFNYATRLGRRSKSPQTMATHGSRPGSRLKQPIGQIPLETAPPVGLSIEEVERLNTPRPRNPSICSADHGRSSSEEDCRRPLSRTRNPADGIPAPESSSDSDSHESFTCSEMEYDRDKPMVYTSRMPKLSQVNESDADDEDNYGARLKPRRYPGRRAEGGPVGAQATSNIAENTLPIKLGQQTGNFNWDNLLNWGPGFGHYVDVFKDLASLPEKAAAANTNEESKGGTTKPVSKDGEAEQYV